MASSPLPLYLSLLPATFTSDWRAKAERMGHLFPWFVVSSSDPSTGRVTGWAQVSNPLNHVLRNESLK